MTQPVLKEFDSRMKSSQPNFFEMNTIKSASKSRFTPSFLLIVVGALAFSGCASTTSEFMTGETSKKVSSDLPKPVVSKTEESVTLSTEPGTSYGAGNSNGLYYRGMKIQNDQFDLPVEMNREVEKWVDYFNGRGRDRFAHYLERSEYFIPFLKPILKNAKAPEDLVFLAMIESGFNNNARSHARAVGAWQFISATGRRYGLKVNWWMDERRDVEKSTIAAVSYLKELNGMFGSWHLAAAAYNAGEAKIQRAIRMYRTDDFWGLCKAGKYLKPETKNYVPKLFAAAIIGKNRKQFGFEESYTAIKNVNAATVAAKAEEGALEKLPVSLENGKEPANVREESLVEVTKDSPADPEEEAMLAQDQVEEMLRNLSNPIRTPHVNRKGEVSGDHLVEVEIPSPADLFKVASAANLTYMEFKSMNPELLRWITPATVSTYKIRLPLSRKDAFVKKYFDPAFDKEVKFLSYKARKGDTASRIAKRFGINPDPVVEMNELGSPNSSIMPGVLVELPIPSDFVRSVASLQDLDLLDPKYPKKPKKKYRASRARKSRKI